MSRPKFNKSDDVPHVRNYKEILAQVQDEEGLKTEWSIQQTCVENNVLKLYKDNKSPLLMREAHIELLKKSLIRLDEAHECLDCSRPWLCYWILHSLDILGERLDDDQYSKVTVFMAKCQSPEGGFGGGPGQYPHLASTFAAVNTLCIIGTREAYKVINRKGLRRFLMTLRREDGSFSMHEGGEQDMRGVYCAAAVARLTNVYIDEMFEDTETWIEKCQSWDGGFGSCPGMEAHGGYAFCGIAALILLRKSNHVCLKSLLRWAVNKQMRLEGGFQGRANKLVDACYSFWQGALYPLIHAILVRDKTVCDTNYWLFNQEALQEYLLICCQRPEGCFFDKPGHIWDIYHTCYALSGLSIAQHSPHPSIIGVHHLNMVEIINPVYNLVPRAVEKALKYFNAQRVV